MRMFDATRIWLLTLTPFFLLHFSFTTDIRPSLSLGVELHRSTELPFLLLLSHHPLDSHAEHLYVQPSLYTSHEGQARQSAANCCDGPDGADLHFSDSSFWTYGFSHGAGVARTHHQWAGDGQVQRRLQSFLAWLLQQLLLYAAWTAVSIVSIAVKSESELHVWNAKVNNVLLNRLKKVKRHSSRNINKNSQQISIITSENTGGAGGLNTNNAIPPSQQQQHHDNRMNSQVRTYTDNGHGGMRTGNYSKVSSASCSWCDLCDATTNMKFSSIETSSHCKIKKNLQDISQKIDQDIASSSSFTSCDDDDSLDNYIRLNNLKLQNLIWIKLNI